MPVTALLERMASLFRRTHTHARQSFSQEGEDLVLARIFDGCSHGYYVDIGAHHPSRFSNTYYFYLRGWCGVNVDPRPGFARAFARSRPRDINLNWAIGVPDGERTYYEFNEPALNTFDPALAANRDGLRGYRVENRRSVRVRPLAAVLAEHVPSGQAISFLTVDVEGLDLQVLESNDWSRYRPEVVVAEVQDAATLAQVADAPITRFLDSQGYRPESKLVRSVVYVRSC